MRTYPIHLLLEDRIALVVGGGVVAAAKARALAEAGARVRIVAPEISEEMSAVIRDLALSFAQKAFEPPDLDGLFLVIAATDQDDVQKTIFEEARRREILVCAVDDPAHSDFISPAVLRRGDLVVTVSTSGVAPALAARLRDYLAQIFTEDFERLLPALREVRQKMRRNYPIFEQRRAAWYRYLDSELLPSLLPSRAFAAKPIPDTQKPKEEVA